MLLTRRPIRILWGGPLLILAAAYILLCLESGTVNIFHVVVHENGRHTFLQTLFYFDHFIREVGIGLMTAWGLAAAFSLYAPSEPAAGHRPKWEIAVVMGLLLSAVIGAVSKTGWNGFWLDLFQFRITDHEVAAGSHWHAHLLHVFFILPFSIGLSFLYRSSMGIRAAAIHRRSLCGIMAWLGTFLLLTVIFRTPMTPLVEVRPLAHQFREIITHGTVTVPLALSWLGFKECRNFIPGSKCKHDRGFLVYGFLWVLAAALIPVWILFQLGGQEVLSEAQKQSHYGDLFASHYFEHFLDYLWTVPLAGIFYSEVFNRRQRS
jgi:hypothetical protein